jgi:hypothetical protein
MTLRIEQPPAGDLDVPLVLGGGPPLNLVARDDHGFIAAADSAIHWVPKAGGPRAASWADPLLDPNRTAEAIANWNPALPLIQRREIAFAAVASALVIAAATMIGRRFRVWAVLGAVVVLIAVLHGLLGASPGALIYSFRVALPGQRGAGAGFEAGKFEDSWLIAFGRRPEVLELASAGLPRPLAVSLDGPDGPLAVFRPIAPSAAPPWLVRKKLTPEERWACTWRMPAVLRAWQPGTAADTDSLAVRLAKFLYADDQVLQIAREKTQDGQWQTVVVLGARD